MRLLPHNGSYPLSRARSVTAAAEDFALVMAAIMQAYGIHARIAVLCADTDAHKSPIDWPVGYTNANTKTGAGADAGAPERSLPCRTPTQLRTDGCQSVRDAAKAAHRPPCKCQSVVEARLGKSPKKLATWLAQHRRVQRASGKPIRGAKTVWYRRDVYGFLWLPLTCVLHHVLHLPCRALTFVLALMTPLSASHLDSGAHRFPAHPSARDPSSAVCAPSAFEPRPASLAGMASRSRSSCQVAPTRPTSRAQSTTCYR
jgi:hypothetical protein